MKLEHIGSNMTLLKLPHGLEIMFSYNTPVAGFKPVRGWFYTTEKYSVTTTKHINKYLKEVGDANPVDQAYINCLLERANRNNHE